MWVSHLHASRGIEQPWRPPSLLRYFPARNIRSTVEDMTQVMRIFALIGLLFTVAVSVTSCASMRPVDFAGTEPQLVFEEYFQGKTRGYGMFFDRFGRAQLSFVIDLEGSWDGTTLTLDEHLKYDSGEELRRTFLITKVSPTQYEVRTEAVVGVGTIEVHGNTAKWTYRLRQQIGESEWVLRFDDWMHLQSDGMLLNRAYASKFGVEFGQVFMAVRKLHG